MPIKPDAGFGLRVLSGPKTGEGLFTVNCADTEDALKLSVATCRAVIDTVPEPTTDTSPSDDTVATDVFDDSYVNGAGLFVVGLVRVNGLSPMMRELIVKGPYVGFAFDTTIEATVSVDAYNGV